MSKSVMEVVKLAIEVFNEFPNIDDDSFVLLLEAKGVSESDAEQVLIFLPMAFTRAMFPDVQHIFQDHYALISHSGRETKFQMCNSTFYNVGFWAVHNRSQFNLDDETALYIASRDSEFKLINQALNAGEKVGDLILAPPMIVGASWRPTEEPIELPNTGISLNRRLPETETERKWWQFWKK